MGFKQNIDLITDGTQVEASVINIPLNELNANDNYLLTLISSISGGASLYYFDVPCSSSVVVGTPVYFNTSTQQYEPAKADGTAKENVIGLCYQKPSSILANVVVLGVVSLDLSAVTSTANNASGKYFLSTTTAGQITTTRPGSGDQIMICIADGNKNVFVMPQDRSITGAAGPTGASGTNGTNGNGSTVTTGAPTLATGRYTFAVSNGAAFPNGCYVFCGDGTNSIIGTVYSGGATNSLVIAPIITAGTVTSIAIGSTFTFGGATGATGAAGPMGLTWSVSSVSANTTLANQTTLLCNAAAGNLTIQLPAAATKTNWMYTVKKIDGTNNLVTVLPNGTDLVEGFSSYIIDSPLDFVALVGDSISNWWAVG